MTVNCSSKSSDKDARGSLKQLRAQLGEIRRETSTSRCSIGPSKSIWFPMSPSSGRPWKLGRGPTLRTVSMNRCARGGQMSRGRLQAQPGAGDYLMSLNTLGGPVFFVKFLCSLGLIGDMCACHAT